MDILHEYGTITSVEQKPTKTGKHFYVYQMNGKKYSSFEDLELVPGTKGRMTYVVNGQYNNAKGFILGDGIAPQEGKPVVEEVLDTPKHEQIRADKLASHNKVKVIQRHDPQEFEDAVNDFCSTHAVFATQTHMVAASNESSYNILHVAVLFYR